MRGADALDASDRPLHAAAPGLHSGRLDAAEIRNAPAIGPGWLASVRSGVRLQTLAASRL